MSDDRDLMKVARDAMDEALKRGVKDVKAVAHRSRSVSVTYRAGRPDRVEESSRRGLTLHLYRDGRYSACDTNDLRADALSGFIDSAVALNGAMAPDQYREITSPDLYEGRHEGDLSLHDEAFATIDPAFRHRMASLAQQAALDEAGDAAISAEATFEDEEEELYRVHSNGFEGHKVGTQAWVVAEVSLRDEGERRPSGWGVGGARYIEDVDDPASIGQGAARRAALRLGARKGPTAVMPMMIENRAAGRFMGSLVAAASGRAIQQRTSFLTDRIGERVGSPLLHLVDEPLIPRGLGSRLFDSEGIAARPMTVFDRGRLANIYVDTYYAKKLAIPPTTGGRSNLRMPPGDRTFDQLLGDMGDGLLVRGFVGGNSNPTTGDFSLGVYGTMVEGGRLGEAVMEMNISGNFKEVFERLAAKGSDPWVHSTLVLPSLVFEGIQVSGG